jgi:hypothetical protein
MVVRMVQEGGATLQGNSCLGSETSLAVSRAWAVGKSKVPCRGLNTMVRHGVEICNRCPDLRQAGTSGQAKKAARSLSDLCPI